MKVDDIRKSFLDYFRARGHTIVESAPVVPHGDPTLLFTNAGMNQFKDVFLGTGQRPYKRAADTQKCIRAGGKHNDLDTVGRDGYHQTFFEMLGNWSFGDYFKAESIEWGWDLLTREWKVDASKLHATIHHSDEESRDLWLKISGLPRERVTAYDKENFWEMGETGPCGPCTEIHIDRGPEACDMKSRNPGHVCKVNAPDGCSRFIELWNHVFIQYERKPDRSLVTLPAKHVDTGMGLERITQVLQGVYSNYDTDLFRPIIGAIEQRTGVKYPGNGPEGTAHRAIADHVRALSFAIADGASPDNTGRGSVLRRILRRASRFFHKLGVTDEPALKDIVPALVATMGDAFPEVKAQERLITQVIQKEEEQFVKTLDKGVAMFAKEREQLAASGAKVLPGDAVFTMKDTYGIPYDVTEQMAEEAGLKIDQARFKELEEEAKDKARKAGKFKVDLGKYKHAPVTAFTGYQHTSGEGRVVAADAQELVLDVTPFYAESGGQVGDTGRVVAVDGSFEFDVLDTQKSGQVFVHYGEWVKGEPTLARPGLDVVAAVEKERRDSIRRNHTGTHLLHWALRQVLGPNAVQKGSLVEPLRLRFDFAHERGLGDDEVAEVERLVNQRIVENAAVKIEELPIQEARDKGAIAMFGEKYGELVRVIDIAGYSCEFCGGTHVDRTGDIGAFKVVQESALQAGVRRVVALTATHAMTRAHYESRLLSSIAHELRARPEEVLERIRRLQEEIKDLQRKNKQALQRQLPTWDDLRGKAVQKGPVKVVAAEVPGANADLLRQFGDAVKRQQEPFVGFFVAAEDGKVPIVCAVSVPLVAEGWNSRDLLKPVAATLGGGGGGKPDLSSGSGKDAAKIGEALALAEKVVAEKAGA
ncbi:MAG: alanine--tRNA ligase [Planctomycetes bacterium]|nr:alanine--tRNA ligase [Planctomycetota bacterium]